MLTVRKRGEKFQAIVRVKEKGVIVHSESRTFDSERLANSWGERLDAQIRREGVPQRRRSSTTLGTYLRDYLAALKANVPVRRARETELVQLMSMPIAAKSLADLNVGLFSEFARARRKDGAAPATVMHNLRTFQSALNSAPAMFDMPGVNGECVRDAIKALSRIGVVAPSRRRNRRIDDALLARMIGEFKRIEAHPGRVIPMATFIELAVALPRRREELTSMRWDDYDAKAHILHLRDTKHPSKPKDEWVPVPVPAAKIIESLPHIDERILPYKPDSVSSAFQRMAKRLGIVDLHLHDLRHEGITRLLEGGMPLQEVAVISGHDSWATLKRYAHLDARAIAEKLHAGTHQEP